MKNPVAPPFQQIFLPPRFRVVTWPAATKVSVPTTKGGRKERPWERGWTTPTHGPTARVLLRRKWKKQKRQFKIAESVGGDLGDEIFEEGLIRYYFFRVLIAKKFFCFYWRTITLKSAWAPWKANKTLQTKKTTTKLHQRPYESFEQTPHRTLSKKTYRNVKKKQLRDRGYPCNLVEKLLSEIKFTRRAQCLKK